MTKQQVSIGGADDHSSIRSDLRERLLDLHMLRKGVKSPQQLHQKQSLRPARGILSAHLGVPDGKQIKNSATSHDEGSVTVANLAKRSQHPSKQDLSRLKAWFGTLSASHEQEATGIDLDQTVRIANEDISNSLRTRNYSAVNSKENTARL